MEFGILSLGNHAMTRVIPAIIDSGNEISAVYSSNRAKGESVAENLGAEYFDTLEKFLSYDMDAVYISSPNFLHYTHAKQSLLSGKDVLLEKPMTLSIQDSSDLVKISEREHRKIAIGFHLRFHPGIQKIKEMLKEGNSGEVRFVYGKWSHLSSHALPSNSWWGIPDQAGGGSIVGTGVHVLDTIVNILGNDIEGVTGVNFPKCKIIEETFLINVHFKNGITANALSSRKIPSNENDLIVMTDRSIIKLTNAFDTKVKSSLFKDEVKVGEYNNSDMYRLEISDFSGAGQYIADGNSGLVSTKLHILSQKSACEGRTLKFE